MEQVYLLYLREKQFSKKALQWQLGCMKMPLRFYGNKPIKDIHKEDICSLIEIIGRTNIKTITLREYLNVLHAVMNWSAEKGYNDKPNFPSLPRAEPERFVPPTIDEVARMIEVAPDHLKRIIIIGVQSGLRVGPSELFSLRWENVDFAQKTLRVHGAKKNMRALWREIPVTDSLLALLREWREIDAYAGNGWIIHFKGLPVKTIRSSWKRMLKDAEITRRIRPYDLRHAFATELIANGADIGTVAKLMGHSSPIMILNHYQYVMDKQKRAAIENLPEIPMCPTSCVQTNKGLRDNTQPLEIYGRDERI